MKILKKFSFLIIFMLFVINVKAQNNGEYKSLELALKEPKKVKKLFISYQGITTLPKEIGNMENLESLYCPNNKITELPKEIGKCKKLKFLSCNNNQLTSLPKEIGNCTELKEVNCNNNQLTSLPKEIGNWVKITDFNCSNNKIPALPKEIGKWAEIYEIKCKYNGFPKVGNIIIPDEISKCKKLKYLSTSFHFDTFNEYHQNLIKLLPNVQMDYNVQSD